MRVNKMTDVIVIGSFVADMVAQVDEFPKDGQSIIGKSIKVYLGGKGANQCVACARLGAKAQMIGTVGNDAYGKMFLDLFTAEGINCENILTTEKEPTAVAQIQINSHGQNKIVVIPSANHIFNVSDIKNIESIIKKSKLVLMQLELRLDVTKELIKTCKRLSVPVILNPAPAAVLEQEVLNGITYLKPNETELEILSSTPIDTDEKIFAAAKKLLSMGVKNVVATLGDRGALIANSDGLRMIEGYKVKALDTVAAGDSFNGALAKCIVEGKSLNEAVKFANAVGALTVTKKGAIPSLPTLKEVEAFIKSKQG